MSTHTSPDLPITLSKHVLSKLLHDRTLDRNISWQTNQYEVAGEGYAPADSVKVRFIAGRRDGVLRPRVNKPIDEQEMRSRDKAEVFTPSWVCNKQNNLIDNQWFGKVGVFNTESDEGWNRNPNAICFPDGKTWKDYVKANRLEVSCGEAPYLTSRYDTVTGLTIPVSNRIGLLDRKLRVVTENCGTPAEWKQWAKEALMSIYGYDWQGDNVLLARENILFAVMEAYQDAFNILPCEVDILEYTHIITWNIWQMDGIKCVVPNSCVDYKTVETLLGIETIECPCQGCKTGDVKRHTGTYCRIMDWTKHKSIRFVDMMREVNR